MAAKYVKLGKKAKGGSFFEANYQVSLYGDKVQKIGIRAFNHKRITRAINAGHLILVEEEEYVKWSRDNPKEAKKGESAYEKQVGKKSKKAEEEEEEEEEEKVDYMAMNKEPLIEYALTLDNVSENFTKEELEDMKKPEIQAEIQEALEEEE